ncbi:MAG: helix-turn-helix transcriptional regulator [Rhodospirillales bacterium]|nr:helix-turn-helix transcriptional regulator [Rhodospirillales bacterium]
MDTEERKRKMQSRPLQTMLGRLSSKWNVMVIRRLSRAPMRPSELRRDIGNISHKMLTQTLRELERYGLIKRHAYPVIPPKVEYSLTDLGLTLVGPLEVLTDWSIEHIDEVEAAIADYDRDNTGREDSI